MPTASEVPETGTRASDLSEGSRGMPRMPSCTEYKRKELTPKADKHNVGFLFTWYTYLRICCSFRILIMCECIVPSQDCWPVLKLYPAVHMHALVVWEVGRHSWEQSPLLLLHRLEPGNTRAQGQICTNKQKVSNVGTNRRDLHKCSSCSLQIRPSRRQKMDFLLIFSAEAV